MKEKFTEKSEKIAFHAAISKKAKLKIKLHQDGLTQARFFRAVMDAYLEDHAGFVSWIEEYKEKNSKIANALQREKTTKLRDSGRETERKFGISEEEIDDIFDIIAKEHPDL